MQTYNLDAETVDAFMNEHDTAELWGLGPGTIRLINEIHAKRTVVSPYFPQIGDVVRVPEKYNAADVVVNIDVNGNIYLDRFAGVFRRDELTFYARPEVAP